MRFYREKTFLCQVDAVQIYNRLPVITIFGIGEDFIGVSVNTITT